MSIIYTIPQNHVAVINRLGKFARIQKAGLRFKLPFIEDFHYITEWNSK